MFINNTQIKSKTQYRLAKNKALLSTIDDTSQAIEFQTGGILFDINKPFLPIG